MRGDRALAGALAATVVCWGAVASAQQSLFSEVTGAARNAIPGEPAQDIEVQASERGLPARVVRIDTEQLADARADLEAGDTAPEVLLNLFNGISFTAVFESAAPTASGYSLSGRLEGERFGTVTLVVDGDILAGAARTPEAIYRIRSVGASAHVVQEVEPPVLSENDVVEAPELRRAESRQFAAAAAEDDGGEIDVLVFYTREARYALGGARRTRAQIDLAVAETNAAYAAGGAVQRIRLVGAVETDYPETGDYGEDIDRLIEDGDGYLDEVHTLRDAYAADLVHLVVACCGGVAPVSPYDPARGFALSSLSSDYRGPYLSAEVFAHELGHNMGLQHDRYAPYTNLNYPFPYSHGYVNQKAFADGPGETACWFTIMAYPGQCADAGLRAVKLMRFSNPEQRYPDEDGDPMGVPGNEESSEVDGPADAVRSLNETRMSVANFRASAERCVYRVSQRDIEVGTDGGSFVVDVENVSNRACPLEAKAQDRFLAVEPGGQEGVFRFRVEPNDGWARFGTVRIAGETIEVRQKGGRAMKAVCDRSPWMRDGITALTGRDDCADVTEFDVASIYELSLNWQEVHGPVQPGDLDGLAGLAVLNLCCNGLTGSFPDVAGLENLQILDFQRNGLTGELPAELGNLERLQRLELSNNALTGAIPPELGKLKRLVVLDLGDNALTGPIPSELGGLVRLQHLKVGNNDLSGSIPRALGDLGLYVLELHRNRLVGCIPGPLERFAGTINPQGGEDGSAVWDLPLCTAPQVCAADEAWTIATFAGTGEPNHGGDGGPAAAAGLSGPYGVAVDASGNVYVAADTGNRIRRIDPDGTIETIAGTGSRGYGGDGGPATEARLQSPKGVAVDAAGNVYVADTFNHRIRRIDPDGKIETIAGTGVAGYSGDGGPAAEARLNEPYGVAVDASGNVYVTDWHNRRIRRIDRDGTIETIAGTGEAGYGGDGGPATQAKFRFSTGVAVDAGGAVYFSDYANQRIRRIAPDGTIGTIAGTGERGFGGDGGPATQAQFDTPTGVAVDASGNLYVADSGNERIRRIVPDGTIGTIAGTGVAGYGGDGGPAVEAQLYFPRGVAVDASGNVYVADRNNNRVRVLQPADDHGDEPDCATPLTLGVPVSGRIETGDDADWFRLELAEPASVAFYTSGDLDTVGLLRGEGSDTENDDRDDDTNFHIEDTWPAGVYFVRVESFEDETGDYTLTARRFADVSLGETGETVRLWASGEGTTDSGWTLHGAPFASGGQVTTSDDEAYVLRFGPGGAWTASPTGGVCAADAGWLIRTIAGTGVEGYGGDGGPAVEARLNNPFDVAVDASGNVYIADRDSHRIRQIRPDGTIRTIAGTGQQGDGGDGGSAVAALLNQPYGVAVDALGNVYVADYLNARIRRIGPDGTIETIAGTGQHGYSGDGGPATQALIQSPVGVAVDAAGRVYFASFRNRIRRVDTDGTIETIAGTSEAGYGGDGGPAAEALFNQPFGVAVDALGNVYVADTFNHRIRRINPAGRIETIAGTGGQGFGGDGGPAVEARLMFPTGVAVDASGNVYVADWLNNRIRRIGPDGGMETIAGTGGSRHSGDGGPAAEAELQSPVGVAVDKVTGRVYVADMGDRVRVLETGKLDDHGDEPDCATPLALGAPVSGRIETDGDADWFRLELAAPASVAFYTSGDLDTIGLLRGEGSDTENDDRDEDTNFHIEGTWPAGAYFVRVQSFEDETGDYTLIARRFADVALGETGETVRLWANDEGTTADGWTLDGVAFVSGGQVTTSDDEAYVLKFGPGGSWTASPASEICLADESWTIETLAGMGGRGYGGDGGAATEALLNYPTGVAADATGNVYVADSSNGRIRRIGPDGTIETIAGTGDRSYGGDGGPATEAQLESPSGVAVDASGNVYVADVYSHVIRRIGPSGMIETIAGTFGGGYGGDGGPAIEAMFAGPHGVAVDASGNLYVADGGNHRVRRIRPDGTIETVAGTGVQGYGGDGGAAVEARLNRPDGLAVNRAGFIYVADGHNHRIRRIRPDGMIETVAGTGEPGYGGDGGPATLGRLSGPRGVAVDALGNVYVADTDNHRIRRIGQDGTIETIAGWSDQGFSGDGGPAAEAQLNNPGSVAVDAAGRVFIADYFNQRVRVLVPVGPDDHGDEPDCATPLTLGVPVAGRIETGSDADWFRLNLAEPASVAFYTEGDLDTVGGLRGTGMGIDIEDDDGGRDSNFHIEGTWAAGVYFVRVASSEGVTGNYSLTARRFADVALGDSGDSVRLWQMADGGWTLYGAPFASGGQVTATNGDAYVLSLGPGAAWTASPPPVCVAGAHWTIKTLAGTGVEGHDGDGGFAIEAELNNPFDVAVDASGYVYVADRVNHRIRRIGTDGTIESFAGTGEPGFSGDGGSATEAQLNYPIGVAVDALGNVYVADRSNDRIRRIGLDGTVETIAGTGESGFGGDGGPATQALLNRPVGVAVDLVGNVYVADTGNERIRRIAPNGMIATIAGTGESGYDGDGGPASQARFDFPFRVAVDSLGNVYVADSGNHRIRRIVPEGTIETFAGTGVEGYGGDGGPAVEAQLAEPAGVAVDVNGYVYVAEFGNSRIRWIAPDGTIGTLAGTGQIGHGGDGGPASEARLGQPAGVAVDPATGHLYVADTSNHRVRVIESTGSCG